MDFPLPFVYFTNQTLTESSFNISFVFCGSFGEEQKWQTTKERRKPHYLLFSDNSHGLLQILFQNTATPIFCAVLCALRILLRLRNLFILTSYIPYIIYTIFQQNGPHIKYFNQTSHDTSILLYLGESANRVRYLQRCIKSLSAIIFMCWGGLQHTVQLLHFETTIHEVQNAEESPNKNCGAQQAYSLSTSG